MNNQEKSFEHDRDRMRSSTRYPYTYCADYLRIKVGDDCGRGLISRSTAAQIKSVIADAIGMDEEELARRVAEKYIERELST